MSLIDAILSGAYVISQIPVLMFISGAVACLVLMFLAALWDERRERKQRERDAETLAQFRRKSAAEWMRQRQGKEPA
jgi:FtsZ-interacting cell division protein ZipA